MNSIYVTLYIFGLDLKDRGLKLRDRARQEDRGATAVEYGLLVGRIAVVIIAAVVTLGGKLSGIFGTVNNKLSTVAPTT